MHEPLIIKHPDVDVKVVGHQHVPPFQSHEGIEFLPDYWEVQVICKIQESLSHNNGKMWKFYFVCTATALGRQVVTEDEHLIRLLSPDEMLTEVCPQMSGFGQHAIARISCTLYDGLTRGEREGGFNCLPTGETLFV